VSDDEMPQQAAPATYSLEEEDEDFSDDDEPWDQRRTDSASIGSSTILAVLAHEKQQQKQQQQLQEGELPTLTPVAPPATKKQPAIMSKTTTTTTPTAAKEQQKQQQQQSQRPRAGWLLRSGQTSRRPLQPPSLAGLTADGEPTPSNKINSPTESEKGRQQQFWSQLDTDPTDDGDEGGGDDDDDDGPDDELAARRSEDEDSGRGGGAGDRRTSSDNNNKNHDNASTAEETLDYSQEGGPAQRGGANTGADFCGDTFNALNEMCGAGLAQTHSAEPVDPENPPDIKPRNRVPLKSDDQEEYTAIEVEFVESNAPSSSGGKEPKSPGRTSGKKKGFFSGFSLSPPVSPGRREAPQTTTLKSLPQQKQEIPPPKGNEQTDAQHKDEENKEETEGEEPDVTAKKSAFLSALARKAKAEFDNSKGAKQRVEQQRGIESKSSGESSLDDDVYSSFTAPEKRKFLKLINTGHLPVDASREILEARAAKEKEKEKKEQANSRKSKRSKRLAFWKKNRSSSTPNAASSSNRSTDEADDPAFDDDEREEESESEQGVTVQPEPASPVIPNAAMSAMMALERKAPRPNSPPPPPPPLEEMGGALSPSRTNETEEERFARSGINYYDAVRRETSDTDDDVAQAEAARQTADKKKTPRRIRPRGFSALRDGVRSQSAPRSSRIPESVSEDEQIHFSTKSRTMESKTMDSSELKVAPTNRTFDKKAQSKGWVGDGEDVFQGAGDEEGVDSLKIRALISPLRGSQNDSTPRSNQTKPVVGQVDRAELPTPKKTGGKVGTSTPRSTRRTVADVAQTKKIGREDEEMLARIEKEILLTAAPKEKPESSPTTKPIVMLPVTKKSSTLGRSVSTPKTRSIGKEERSVSTPKMRPTGNDEPPLSKNEQNEFKLELDVDLETYMHSADVYSAAAQDRDTPHSDGRSVFTATTTGSVYTQSSRRRRPGAARTRLAKAKEVLQKQAAKKNGWHDSIQAAAASTNRVWKPGTGWVDYVDTSEDALLPKSDEKLQLNNLKKALTKNQKQERDPSQRSVVPVPFPKDWERERQQMIDSGMGSLGDSVDDRLEKAMSTPQRVGRNVSAPPTARSISPAAVLGVGMPSGPSPHEPLPVQLEDSTSIYARRNEKGKRMKKNFSPAHQRMIQKQEKDQGKPTGWLASMQAATAALSQEGKSWDAEHGWTMPEKEEQRISDVVDFGSSPSTGSRGEISDVVDFNVPPPPPPTSSSVENRDTQRPDGKLTQWVEKSGKEANAGSSAADMSERAVASGASTEPEVDSSRRFVAGVSTEPEADGSVLEVAGVSTEPEAAVSANLVAAAAGVSTESYRGSNRSVTSSVTNNTEKYVQISDNGSVRAMKQILKPGQRPAVPERSLPTQVESEDSDARASNDSLGAFPSTDDRPASAAVNIQKINDEDLNLFPEETREKRADRGFIAGHRSPARTPPRTPPPTTVPPSLSMASSAESSRRGGGPIDTDDVDETWDSDDDRRYSTGWETRSGASGKSSSKRTPNTPVPRLKENKKDTSPLRGRNLTARLDPESNVKPDVSANKTSAPNSPVSPGIQAWRKEQNPPTDHDATDWPNEHDEVSYEGMSRPTAEWKSFMGKKVSAETAAASQQRAQGRGITGVRSEDEDSLFHFDEKKLPNIRTNFSSINARERPREDVNGGEYERPYRRNSGERQRRSHGDYSDGEDKPDSVVYGSEGYGPSPENSRTFLQRLTECAAPVVQNARNQVGPMIESARNHVNDLPSAHLAFMKNGNFSPSNNPLSCGKADVIDEEDTVDESEIASQERKERPRSKSTPKSRRSGSSVASDDFGAKTAYLEAIAMKAAVSKPRRASSRGRGGSSVVSSSSSQHSEKWKSFLERKKAAGVSPGKGRSSHASDVSKAAERYAASKVEEMVAEMNAESVSSPGARRDVILRKEYSEDTDDYSALRSYRSRDGSRDDAAQELSAARVQAMMTQLSADQSQFDEEAEI